MRECLCNGLSALIAADPGRKGRYYSAFFEMSIGAERLMKLVFILDHMARNELRAPSRQTLKSLGHDLVAIYSALQTLGGGVPALLAGTIEEQLLTFLSDFAKATRYYNFDALAAGQANLDPLDAYNRLFLRIISEDVEPRKLARISNQAAALAALTESHTLVVGYGLDGQLISNKDAFMLGPLHAVGAPHVVWRLYQLLQPVRRALAVATDDAGATNRRLLGARAAVPFMAEWLDFLGYERAYVLKKRRWP